MIKHNTEEQCKYNEEQCKNSHRLLVWTIGIIFTLIGLQVVGSAWAVMNANSVEDKADETRSEFNTYRASHVVETGHAKETLGEIKSDVKEIKDAVLELRLRNHRVDSSKILTKVLD